MEAPEGNRCVDIFQRPDGTFGFEEYRRDPECVSGWFVTGHYGDEKFEGREAAIAAARERVIWLMDRTAERGYGR